MGSGKSRIVPSSHVGIFLGGSCNPTTWRKDITTPILEHNIAFYNPQFNNWTPDQVEIEEKAKENSLVLLFVIDNQTRDVASIVEAAYYIGCGRRVVLVLMNIVEPINGISKDEIEDLNKGRTYLANFAKRENVPVFKTVQEGVKECIKIVSKIK